jgi:hypothetical protein
VLRKCYGVRLGPGTPLTRDILFVYEDGIWLRRFTKEENKLYIIDTSLLAGLAYQLVGGRRPLKRPL